MFKRRKSILCLLIAVLMMASASTAAMAASPYIDCYAKLQKTYSTYKGKETNIRLTYIHTYQSTVGSISFQGGSSGVAAGVSLSRCDKQWQIEISYFLEMTDMEIAELLNMVRSSVAYRRTATLKLLKELMGGKTDDS